MELRKTSGLLACATVLALALLSGCGSSSNSTTIPATTSIFNAHSILFRNHSTMTLGYNAFGQLGLGHLDNAAFATPVTGLGKMDSISAGGDHSLASSQAEPSTVYAWGSNYHGQIGIATVTGTAAFSSTPVKLTLAGAAGPGLVTQVAAGSFHSLALMDGEVFSWGYNLYGQLGDRAGQAAVDSITPAKVLVQKTLGTPLGNVKQIAAGGGHSLALTNDGIVYAWGYNNYGQLGSDPTNINNLTVTTPAAVSGLPLGDPATAVVQVAAGGSSSYAVTADGKLFAWGFNGKGQLGQAANAIPNPTPVQVTFPAGTPNIVQVAAGLDHVLARDAAGGVWAWGLNEYGQLGDGGVVTTFTFTPFNVAALAPFGKATDILVFGNSSLAFMEISPGVGTWYGWGDNGFGELGQPASTTTLTKQFAPTPVR